MQPTNERILWKRTLDGLYHATFPKHVSVNNLVKMWAEIFNDYAEHFAGAGPLLILIDGSRVEQYDMEAMAITTLHVVPGNADVRVAIHSRSAQYINASTIYFRAHLMPQNMHYFDTATLARSWLNEILDRYNRSTHT
jgi:hypothetical protein